MSSGEKTVHIIVRSRRVPVGVTEMTVATPTLVGTRYGQTYAVKRAVVYGDVLDEEQERALKDARTLALASGSRLVITDLAREHTIMRMIRRLAGNALVAPVLMVSGRLAMAHDSPGACGTDIA